MKIIQITALPNGGHRNLIGDIETIPDGWAVVPDEIETENFPFGDITVEEVDGVMTVTSWTPGEIPMVEEPEPEITEMERLRADVEFIAIMTGVEL